MKLQNYLLLDLENYYPAILSMEGKLIVLNSFLNQRTEEIIKENKQNKMLVSAITMYRDLSDLEADVNLFTPNYSYLITTKNIQNEVEDIISQHCCFVVSQAYEAFETFLIDILTNFLFNNQNKLIDLKFASQEILLIKATIREMVRKEKRVNNKGILAMIRKLSPHFKKFESRNIYGVDITRWFDLVSIIRHVLVHNRQIVSPTLLEYLEAQKANELFTRHFQRKKIGDYVCIFLKKDTAADILNWLNGFAYFIFVSLSKEANLPTNVPQYDARLQDYSSYYD